MNTKMLPPKEDKMDGKMEFFYQFEETAPKIVMTISPQSSLDEVFESFEQFLKGCGYSFEGNIEIVNDELIEANNEQS